MNVKIAFIIFTVSLLIGCNFFSKPHIYFHLTDEQMSEKLNDNESNFNKLARMFNEDRESGKLNQGWINFNDAYSINLSKERLTEFFELMKELDIKRIEQINESEVKGYFFIVDDKFKKESDNNEADRKGYFYTTKPPYFQTKFGSEDYSEIYYKKLNKDNWYIRHDTFVFEVYD